MNRNDVREIDREILWFWVRVILIVAVVMAAGTMAVSMV